MKKLILILALLSTPAYATSDIYSGLTAWWTLDSSSISGTTVTDNSGNGNSGTLDNSPTSAPGVLAQSRLFNGANQGILVSSSPMGTSSEGTVAAWVIPARGDTPLYTPIVITRFGCGGGAAFGLYTSGFGAANMVTSAWSNTSAEFNANTGLIMPNLQWSFVAATANASGLTIYLNGQSFFLSEALGSETFAISTTSIGEDCAGAGRNWNGNIDDVRFYNRALSAAEIQMLYYHGLSQHQIRHF